LLDEGGIEAVKAGSDRRVGSEEVPRSRDSQGHVKRLPCLFHEAQGAFQHGEGRMTFIQMTDFWLKAECAEQPPSADPEEQFLLEAQFRPSSIEFAGNPTVGRKVRRVFDY
jgi:hypothetical protein